MSQYAVRAVPEADRRSAAERALRIVRAECRCVSYRWGMAWHADDVYGAVVERMLRYQRDLLLSPSSEEALLRWVARRAAVGELGRERLRDKPVLEVAVTAHSEGSRGCEAASRRRAVAMAEAVRLAAQARHSPLRERIARDVATLAEECSGYYMHAVEHGAGYGVRALGSPSLASVARYLGLRPSEVRELRRLVRESSLRGLAE